MKSHPEQFPGGESGGFEKSNDPQETSVLCPSRLPARSGSDQLEDRSRTLHAGRVMQAESHRLSDLNRFTNSIFKAGLWYGLGTASGTSGAGIPGSCNIAILLDAINAERKLQKPKSGETRICGWTMVMRKADHQEIWSHQKYDRGRRIPPINPIGEGRAKPTPAT